MSRPLARWLLTLTLAGMAIAPAALACVAPTESGLQSACCCPQADGACHMTCDETPDVQPTVAAPAPHPTVMLAVLSHAPQTFLTAVSPASGLEVSAPAAIPKHYLRTHTLRL